VGEQHYPITMSVYSVRSSRIRDYIRRMPKRVAFTAVQFVLCVILLHNARYCGDPFPSRSSRLRARHPPAVAGRRDFMDQHVKAAPAISASGNVRRDHQARHEADASPTMPSAAETAGDRKAASRLTTSHRNLGSTHLYYCDVELDA